MARQEVKVEYADGNVVNVRITPYAEVMSERHFGIGIGHMQKEFMAEHIYYMTWASLHFGGGVRDDFEKWLESIADLEMVEDPNAPDNGDPSLSDQPLTSS